MIHKKSYFSTKGFTLLELIVVMAILGALASIVMVQYPSAQKRARDSQRMSDLRQYQTLLEVYANNNDGNYPPSSSTLTSMCGPTNDLKSSICPTPPQALGDYVYEYNSSDGSYFIYVQLESPNAGGNTVYQYYCSNGSAGQIESTTNPC